MRRRSFLVLAAGLAALAVVAVVAVPLLVPTGDLKAEIERRVSAQTGRAFRIAGPLRFTLFPDIGLDARDVSLANAPGGRAHDLIHIDRMRIAAKLLPLFSGKVEAREVVLERPAIALEVDRAGRANWTLIAAPGMPHAARIGPPPGTLFAGLRIEDGALTYTNDRIGSQRAIEGLSADVTLTRLNAPASAVGDFVFRGRKLAYSIRLTTVENLLAGKTTRANATLTSDFLNAGFFGTVTRDGIVAGTGSLRTPSLKDVAAWAGHPISAGSGLGPLDVTARIIEKDRDLSLDHIEARLDGMRAGGYLRADLTHDVPDVSGRLDIDRLDLNTYLNAGGAKGTPAPRKPGPPAAEGWSRTPLKLDVVKLINGQLAVNVDTLTVLHLKLGKTSIALSLADGLVTAHMSPMTLYGGSGGADLTLDTSGPLPVLANRLAFRGIAMRPFLADTIGNDRIDGQGTITLDVASRGASPDAIMHALSGKGTVAIGHGRIQGVDMGRVARTIATILSAGATGDGATTDFDNFTGSFAIANGVLANNDLKMSGAFINIRGRGHLDLGNRTIAFRIEPTASLGGRLHLLDVGVPFDITGPWSHVVYQPDIAGAIGGLLNDVIDKGAAPVEGLIDRLDGARPKPGTDPKKKNKGVGDTLKDIFGLH